MLLHGRRTFSFQTLPGTHAHSGRAFSVESKDFKKARKKKTVNKTFETSEEVWKWPSALSANLAHVGQAEPFHPCSCYTHTKKKRKSLKLFSAGAQCLVLDNCLRRLTTVHSAPPPLPVTPKAARCRTGHARAAACPVYCTSTPTTDRAFRKGSLAKKKNTEEK